MLSKACLTKNQGHKKAWEKIYQPIEAKINFADHRLSSSKYNQSYVTLVGFLVTRLGADQQEPKFSPLFLTIANDEEVNEVQKSSALICSQSPFITIYY